MLNLLWHGLRDSLLMTWQIGWALAFGFFISAIVQAWVPRERIQATLSAPGPGTLARATALGAASSSCSYAAVAIARSLFVKGASAAAALAFQFASTNLVWELGLVLWVLIGWQFTAGEFLGGLLMIALMAALLRTLVSKQTEQTARAHAEQAAPGHQHHMAESNLSLRTRLTSAAAWSDVAHNFRGDLQMLWREIVVGLLLAGFVAQIPNSTWNVLFLHHAPSLVQTVWSALIGPLIAVMSFVCSVGNVPLAAVLWSGGISFAGVMAFIFADLIILPILLIYRKLYGTSFAIRIAALMFVTMVLAALAIDGLFSALTLVPHTRPTRANVFGDVAVNQDLFLNLAALILLGALLTLTARRGATDPVCGMKVDRAKALTLERDGRTLYFCSEHCRATFIGQGT